MAFPCAGLGVIPEGGETEALMAEKKKADPERLLSCRNLPIRYLFIPKCGCTFVKNLIWRLDHGQTFHNPKRIHDVMDDFARASAFGLDDVAIRAEEHAFTILRNPVDRFLSLYFDKVVGSGWQKYVPLRATLQRHGLNVEAATPEEHRRNCMIMVDWLEVNLSDGNELPREAHWTPQWYRGDVIKGFDLKLLTLTNLDARMEMLLRDLVPDIGAVMAEMERYATNSKDRKASVLDQKVKSRINQVYRRDREIFEKLKDIWRDTKPARMEDIPRASQVL